jgi:hypothetical protein
VTAPTLNDPSVAPWQSVDAESLADASVEALDRFFLELCRRTVGGDLRSATPVASLEIAGVERYATRRFGSPAAGLLRAERVALDGGPSQPPIVSWDVHGVAGIVVRARFQPERDGRPATIRVPVQLRDEHALPRFLAAWRQTFGAEPKLAALRPERARKKGPPFRCPYCSDALASEPEDSRACPRCLATLEAARPIAAGVWGPLRAELHGAGLHRLFSSFTRSMATDVAMDVVFDAYAQDAAVPPSAGVAIGPMGATRTLLVRPDGTFSVTREQLVQGGDPGTYPRERVMVVDWTTHSALGRGLDERTRLRVAVDAYGMRAWAGEHVLFELPAAPDDADGKCVCLVAGCDVHGTSVRFERFQVETPPGEDESTDDITIVDRTPGS